MHFSIRSATLLTATLATMTLAGCGREYAKAQLPGGLAIQTYREPDQKPAVPEGAPRPYQVNETLISTDLTNASYQAGMTAVQKAGNETDLKARAGHLKAAKAAFLTGADELKDEPGDAAICRLNAASCAANLGDNAEVQRIMALVPCESPWRWYHNARLIQTQTQGNTTHVDGGGVIAWIILLPIRIVPALCTGFQWTWPHTKPTPEEMAIYTTGTELKTGKLNKHLHQQDHEITKTVEIQPEKKVRRMQFNWSAETPDERSLRDITVKVVPEIFGNTVLSGIRLEVANKMERVISITNMAGRFELFSDDQMQKPLEDTYEHDFKTINAENRLLPNVTTVVGFGIRVETGSLSKARTGRLTVFDIPAEFDPKLGTLQQKINLTWDFQFIPGQDAMPAKTKQERDPTRSSVTYDIITSP